MKVQVTYVLKTSVNAFKRETDLHVGRHPKTWTQNHKLLCRRENIRKKTNRWKYNSKSWLKPMSHTQCLKLVSIVISSQFEYSTEVCFENQRADFDFWNNSESNWDETFLKCLFYFILLARQKFMGKAGEVGGRDLLQMTLLCKICLRALCGAEMITDMQELLSVFPGCCTRATVCYQQLEQTLTSSLGVPSV